MRMARTMAKMREQLRDEYYAKKDDSDISGSDLVWWTIKARELKMSYGVFVNWLGV